MVAGVPGGTWMGELMSWRLPFFVVAAMGALATAGLWRVLPSLKALRSQAIFSRSSRHSRA
ncbi:MAG: hypothetical protein CPDRYMAC_4850 [uncultured Paraburkholderia sp.]|nr:MAG: hypothetical protein CPDRYMAC_4850 [uncultured Paraburkholderia sp.]